MANWNNTSKSSSPSWANPSKSTTSFGNINQVKAGLGWLMGQAFITMGGATDPISGNAVLMGALGTPTVWTTLNES